MENLWQLIRIQIRLKPEGRPCLVGISWLQSVRKKESKGSSFVITLSTEYTRQVCWFTKMDDSPSQHSHSTFLDVQCSLLLQALPYLFPCALYVMRKYTSCCYGRKLLEWFSRDLGVLIFNGARAQFFSECFTNPFPSTMNAGAGKTILFTCPNSRVCV